ncbi:hypothetical protein U1Q18_017485 [Sarracenia purpurea var. burkii]
MVGFIVGREVTGQLGMAALGRSYPSASPQPFAMPVALSRSEVTTLILASLKAHIGAVASVLIGSSERS